MTNGIVLSVLAAVAKQERITLSERTVAGLQRARRAGKRLGRRAVQVDVSAEFGKPLSPVRLKDESRTLAAISSDFQGKASDFSAA